MASYKDMPHLSGFKDAVQDGLDKAEGEYPYIVKYKDERYRIDTPPKWASHLRLCGIGVMEGAWGLTKIGE